MPDNKSVVTQDGFTDQDTGWLNGIFTAPFAAGVLLVSSPLDEGQYKLYVYGHNNNVLAGGVDFLTFEHVDATLAVTDSILIAPFHTPVLIPIVWVEDGDFFRINATAAWAGGQTIDAGFYYLKL